MSLHHHWSLFLVSGNRKTSHLSFSNKSNYKKKGKKKRRREILATTCGAEAAAPQQKGRADRQGGIGERGLTAVVAVIQRPETTTPTATTERKRKAAVVLDSAALSTVRVRQSAAAVAMAAGRRGPDGHCSRPARLRESRGEPRSLCFLSCWAGRVEAGAPS